MSLIPLLIPFGLRCLHTHTEILTFTSLINISILLSEYHTAQTTRIFKGEQREAAEVHCGLSAVQCQHRVAHAAYPPYLEQRERRATTDTKLVLNFGERQGCCHCVKKQGEQRVKIRSCDESSSWSLKIITVYLLEIYYILAPRLVLLIGFLAEAVPAQTAGSCQYLGLAVFEL